MSYSLKHRTIGYDNIAAGSATGRERTIAGALPPAEMYPSGLGDTAGAQHVTNIVQGATDSAADHENEPTAANPLAIEALGSSNIAGMTS